jgi:protein-disulfide isomerase
MQMNRHKGNVVAIMTLALSLIPGPPAMATHQSRAVGNFDAEDSRNIEEIVREYILDHPEVIAEAIQKLRAQQQQVAEQKRREAAGSIKPVDGEDHIRGDPDASVKLVEFSDFECPFCKRVHTTLQQIMVEYGEGGQVAWVYRHFPLDSLHKKARKEAQASECADELGGNDAFWAYTDRLFDITPSNDRLDLSILPKVAEEIGLDRGAFVTCLSGDARGGKYADHIEANYQDAVASGGTGTPHIVIIAPDGEVFPVSGAQPYGAFKSIIDLALSMK